LLDLTFTRLGERVVAFAQEPDDQSPLQVDLRL